MSNKDVFGSQASHNVSVGIGTRLRREKLVERIGALCAAQRKKRKRKGRRG